MPNRIYFSQLAQQLGIPGEFPPGPPPDPTPNGLASAPPEGPDQPPMAHPNVWRKEGGERLLLWLKERYHPGDTFEFDGHGDCWLMLAIMDQLRECRIQTYIGAFDRTLPITAYQTGPTQKAGQPCSFTVETQGDSVLLTVHLDPEKGPFDMPFGEIVAPEIPAGKDIYVRLDGRHLLFTFPIALTYGPSCRSIVMDYSGECFCSVSHSPARSVGDLVESPFAT